MNKLTRHAILGFATLLLLASHGRACDSPYVSIYDWLHYVTVGEPVEIEAYEYSGTYIWDWWWEYDPDSGYTVLASSDTLGRYPDDDPSSSRTLSFSSPGQWRVDAIAENEYYLTDYDYAYVYVIRVTLGGGGFLAVGDVESISLSMEPSLYFGEVTLSKSCSGDGDISVYYDSQATEEVTLPKTWDLRRHTVPGTLYVKATDASSSEDDVSLTLSYVKDSQTIDSDAESFTVFDVEIDKCNPSWLPKKPGAIGYKTSIAASVVPALPSVCKDFRFSLYAVSDKLGYCVNGGSQQGKDLKFEQQAGWTVSGNDDEIAEKLDTYDSQVTVAVSSFDYGAYGKIECEVTMLGGSHAAHIFGGSQSFVRIPRDDDENQIADGWTYNAGGANDDMEKDPNEGDGLTRYEEYRGVDIDNDGFVTAGERLNPNARRDLFVEGVGFDVDFPFIWGYAFDNAGVDVHEIGSSAGRRDIDVLSVSLYDAGGDPHIYQFAGPENGQRNWSYKSGGYSRFLGSETQYPPGDYPHIYRNRVNCMSTDKPYEDHTTWIAPGQWDDDPNGNGVLDPLWLVEDADDDGNLDPSEDDGAANPPPDDDDGELDGDFARWLTWGGTNWDLSPLNIDNDDYIEWPPYSDPNELDPNSKDPGEYSREQRIRHVITHEMGHAVGIRPDTPQWSGHCDDPTCCMYKEAAGFYQYNHFCDDCRAHLHIHNNPNNDPPRQ